MLDKGFPTLKSTHFWYFDNECLTFFLNRYGSRYTSEK